MTTDPFARKSSGGAHDSPVPTPPEELSARLLRLIAELRELRARLEKARA